MEITIPLVVEVRGTARSSFTRETVERRLAAIRGRDGAADEVAFLEQVLAQIREPITSDKL